MHVGTSTWMPIPLAQRQLAFRKNRIGVRCYTPNISALARKEREMGKCAQRYEENFHMWALSPIMHIIIMHLPLKFGSNFDAAPVLMCMH